MTRRSLVRRVRRWRPSVFGSSGFPWSAPTWPTDLERPAPERGLGVDYDTTWAREYPARLARAVVLDTITRPLAHVVASPEVRGADVLSLVDPPVIFVANHTSHADTPILLSVLPARLRHKTVVAAAADHFFDRRWKAHLWAGALALIPIERHRVNRRSAQLAADLVNDGWNLVIYPEGGRSHDGWFADFRGGAAYLATRTARPVVPVHIDGTWGILPRGSNRLHRSPTTVSFGNPIVPVEGDHTRRLEARIETALATLADETRTDWWTARRRAAAGTTPSPRGPDAAAWRRAWELGRVSAAADDDNRWALERR
ncbi:MAG TPA: lysophospholipid acyltransferase family protein [Acidimicrobiales bacterium]|nr:lysophospholipid acyltransferase family protein [Acidimicrobiales bacterium]